MCMMSMQETSLCHVHRRCLQVSVVIRRARRAFLCLRSLFVVECFLYYRKIELEELEPGPSRSCTAGDFQHCYGWSIGLSCSSDSTPSLQLPCAADAAVKKERKKNKRGGGWEDGDGYSINKPSHRNLWETMNIPTYSFMPRGKASAFAETLYVHGQEPLLLC